MAPDPGGPNTCGSGGGSVFGFGYSCAHVILYFLSHPDHGHGHLPERRRESALLDGQQLGAGRLQLDLRPAGPGPGHAPRGRAGDDSRAAGGARARRARGAQAVEPVPAAGRVGKNPGF